MNLISDIAKQINGLSDNVYLDDMPDTPDNSICIYNISGEAPRHSMNSKIVRPFFKVVVRNTSSADAITLTQSIKNELDGLCATAISFNLYISIFLRSNVITLGKDNRNRSQFSLDFEVKTVKDYQHSLLSEYLQVGGELVITGKGNTIF